MINQEQRGETLRERERATKIQNKKAQEKKDKHEQKRGDKKRKGAISPTKERHGEEQR